MKLAFLRFVASVSVLFCSPGFGREICWIDHVLRSADGVSVYFSTPSSVQAFVGPKENPSAGRYFIRNGTVVRDGIESDHLTLAFGSSTHLSQTPEDVCTLEVIDEPDKKGVLAKASNHMPGVAAATASRFVPAL